MVHIETSPILSNYYIVVFTMDTIKWQCLGKITFLEEQVNHYAIFPVHIKWRKKLYILTQVAESLGQESNEQEMNIFLNCIHPWCDLIPKQFVM